MSTDNSSASGQSTRKWILAFEPMPPQAATLGDTLTRWAEALADSQPALRRIELDLYEPREHALHTGQKQPPAWQGFVSLWSPDNLEDMALPVGLRAHRFEVDEFVARDFVRDWDLSKTGPGIKKLVFWSAAPGVRSQRWQSHYREHVGVAFAAHRAWKYRQNVILVKPAHSRFDAVSENWWRDPTDLSERFYASPEYEKLVALDTNRFIDKSSAITVVVSHRIVFE